MNPKAVSFPDLVAFGVKASAESGVSVAEVQRAYVRAVRAAYSPAAAMAAAATCGFLKLLAREGGSVSAREAAKLYGGKSPVSSESVRKAAKAGSLIGVQDGLSDWLSPIWQFGERGGLLLGLREAVTILRAHHPQFDSLVPITFFLNPSPLLGGKTPLEALRSSNIEPVLQLARAARE